MPPNAAAPSEKLIKWVVSRWKKRGLIYAPEDQRPAALEWLAKGDNAARAERIMLQDDFERALVRAAKEAAGHAQRNAAGQVL